MIDSQGRKIDYLRISITDRCNLRCIYCMPEKGIELLMHDKILTFEEILRIVKNVAILGISKIRITGGEPLVRLGIVKLIKDIKQTPGIEEVSITTNGILLEDYIDELIEAGLDRLNISLDTLKEDTYKEITRNGSLKKVLTGIDLAIEKGISRVKLNTVIIKGINFSEIMDFVRFSEEKHIDVRFIELMPIGEGSKFTPVSNDEIKRVISKERNLTPFNNKIGSGPATYYKSPLSKGSVGFISAISHEFCSNCNRVRLTAEGFLKLCLFWDKGIDLKKLLRNGIDDERILEILTQAIFNKPAKHEMNGISLKEEDLDLEKRKMFQIGG